MEELKFCKDCKHAYEEYGMVQCSVPTTKKIDLVTGSVSIDGYISARHMREDPLKCGRSAKLFEAAPIRFNRRTKLLTVVSKLLRQLPFIVMVGIVAAWAATVMVLLYQSISGEV